MQIEIGLDSSDRKLLVVKSWDDVEEVLEHNKRLRSMPQKSDWGRHVASIPDIIYNKWLNEQWESGNTKLRAFGEEMSALVARKLRDPDWAYLRTDNDVTKGHIGWQR